MHDLFKEYQFHVALAILILTIFLGLGLPMIFPSTLHNGIIIIIVGIVVSLPFFWLAFRFYKRQKQTNLSTDNRIEKYLSETTHKSTNPSILQIKQEEPSNHPPIVLNIFGVLCNLFFLAIGCFAIYEWVSGKVVVQFTLGWVFFFAVFVALPILIFVGLVFDRKYYRLGRSRVAKDAEFLLTGDVNTIFDSCELVLKTMKAEIIRYKKPKLLKGKIGRSNFTVEINLLHRKKIQIARVYALSDARWVTVKFDRGINQKNIDTFRGYFDYEIHSKSVNEASPIPQVAQDISNDENSLDTIAHVRPSINVKPVNDSSNYFLEVKNIGATGTFEANIQVISGHLPDYTPFNHKGCWEQSTGKETRILNGQSDRLKIARREIPNVRGLIAPLLSLELCYWNLKTNQENYARSYSWIPGARNITTNGTESPMEKPEFILSVIISAVEGLRGGNFTRQYRLNLEGLEELKSNG